MISFLSMRSLKYLLIILIFNIKLYADPLLDCYRANCQDDIRNKAEQLLQSKKYWLERLIKYDTDFGYYENIKHLLIVNKNEPWLDLYEVKKDHLVELISTIDVIVGKNSGQKLYRGDLKTPTGTYKLTERLNKLDQFYGPTAIVIAYPNPLDKILGRTGSGIWIHGFPVQEDRGLNENTKGCVAMENNRIITLADTLTELDKTLIILADGRLPKVSKNDLASIMYNLYTWLASWRENEFKKYISFYSRKFKTVEGNDVYWFKNIKEKIFSENRQIDLHFSRINIAPYPNNEGRNIFFITGYIQYFDGKRSFNGEKELYIELNNNSIEILIER